MHLLHFVDIYFNNSFFLSYINKNQVYYEMLRKRVSFNEGASRKSVSKYAKLFVQK